MRHHQWSIRAGGLLSARRKPFDRRPVRLSGRGQCLSCLYDGQRHRRQEVPHPESGDIPPELGHMLWTKARDGSKDIFVHVFGVSEPSRMNWTHLRETARKKISDSSCKKCHSNITAKGIPLKAIVAHRAYQRMEKRKRCVDCHTTEFHGNFKDNIFGSTVTQFRRGPQSNVPMCVYSMFSFLVF